MKTEDDLWKLIDEYFDQEVKTNEAIKTMYDYHGDAHSIKRGIKIDYARITDNRLFQHNFDIDMDFLRSMSDSTVITIMKDILDNRFRRDAEP